MLEGGSGGTVLDLVSPMRRRVPGGRVSEVMSFLNSKASLKYNVWD